MLSRGYRVARALTLVVVSRLPDQRARARARDRKLALSFYLSLSLSILLYFSPSFASSLSPSRSLSLSRSRALPLFLKTLLIFYVVLMFSQAHTSHMDMYGTYRRVVAYTDESWRISLSREPTRTWIGFPCFSKIETIDTN